ncbi:MAG: AraC family transcriptional regulator [Bacteroidota bacterium]
MQDFFWYLTSSPEDRAWGVYLTVGGRYMATKGAQYPRKEHPTGYYFDWETGRILNEFQLIFISEGKGVLETHAGVFEIGSGTIIIIIPGTWHRYRPDTNSGWTEYYIGFDGQLSEHFMAKTFDNTRNQLPFHCTTNSLEILDTYQKILDLVATQKPGYHQVASGLILKLLGYIKAQSKAKTFDEIHVEGLVNSAKSFIWEHVHENADLKEYSRNQSVSYSYFRKVFKLYTGIAPHQFYLDLKIMRAKELLVANDKSVKAISYELGFESIHYFSRLFKKKTGMSPTGFKLMGNSTQH